MSKWLALATIRGRRAAIPPGIVMALLAVLGVAVLVSAITLKLAQRFQSSAF